MTIRLRAVKSEKNSNDSEYGARYAFLTVGTNPKTSTVVRVTTAHNGSDVIYQNGKEDIELWLTSGDNNLREYINNNSIK